MQDSITDDNKPKVSALLTVYNQVGYIRAALESALAQDYSPFEIVISDDGSTDGTIELVEDILRDYHGPHRVVFNRNATNLGIALNFEKAFSLASGMVVFTFGGDDISLPNRVSEMMRQWLSESPRPTVMGSAGWKMTDQKSEDEPFNGLAGAFVVGAFAAYSRRVFDEFPRLDPAYGKLMYEDSLYGNRAQLIGRQSYCPTPLLRYRYGSGVSTGGVYRRKMLRGSKAVEAAYRQLALDIDGRDEFSAFRVDVDRTLRHEASCQEMLVGTSVFRRFRGFCRIKAYRSGLKGCLVSLVMCLPMRVGDWILAKLIRG